MQLDHLFSYGNKSCLRLYQRNELFSAAFLKDIWWITPETTPKQTKFCKLKQCSAAYDFDKVGFLHLNFL
jgi:hypothetical protein